MIANKTYRALALSLLLLFTGEAYGQANTTAVNNTIKSAESYFNKLPTEKLYLHFDKPYYTIGDTIRFKGYLVTSATRTASALSNKLYLELLNDSNKLVTRLVIPLAAGLGEGYLPLNSRIHDGSYKIRAYTNWMQNFDEGSFFNRQFFIGKPSDKGGWMVNEQHTVKKTDAGNRIDMAVQLKDLANAAIPNRDVVLKLTAGTKTLVNSTQKTSQDGEFNAAFDVPTKTNSRDLTLFLIDKTLKNSTLSIPFYPGGYLQNIDLQFMPEAGNMTNGLYNKVGFKIIGDDGKGIAVKGIIRDSKNEEITSFQSLHNGMGSFMLLPLQNEKYTATISLAGGYVKTVDMPLAKPSGIAMRIDNTSRTDSVSVYLTATPDIASLNNTYTLIVQSKDAVHFGTTVNLNAGFKNLRVAKSLFKTGILSFVLLNDQNQPLNERRIFIDQHDRLNMALSNHKYSYQPKDSVAVNIQVTDKAGKPIQGSFSVAVTDDVTLSNGLYANNIYSHLLLGAELKGNIEEPAWYFTSADANREKTLDNLLLTQGWTGYNWLTMPASEARFMAENDNMVSGTLLNVFKKPIKNAQVTLYASSKKYGTIAVDTVTNANGKFMFSNLPLFDTIAYTIKAHNNKGKSIGATIVVDEFKPAPITLADEVRSMPWYAKSSDSLMMKYFNRPNQPVLPGINAEDIKGNLLKEVTIKAQKQRVTIGNEDGFPIKELSEQELIAAGKKSLLKLLFEKYSSFRETNIYARNIYERPENQYITINRFTKISNTNFCIGTSLIYDVFIDDTSMKRIYGNLTTQDSTTYYRALKDFMEYTGADDVKEVKIMGGLHTFMTITTRSGAGPQLRVSQGSAAYRPLPMLLPKQFYSPRYTVKNAATLPDYRTTIFWEPNLVTDENGKATLSFYAADKPSTYSIRIEGSDMAGSIGYETGKISVTSATGNR